MAKSIFDDTDLSDLSADDRKEFEPRSSSTISKDLLDLLEIAKKDGIDKVDIRLIRLAAKRSKVKLPSKQTMVKYLNQHVKKGVVTKPTRQTYALA